MPDDPSAPDPAETELAKKLVALHPEASLQDARRFLRARGGNFKKAEAFLAADLEWRRQTQPQTITQADLPISLPSGCWRMLGDGTLAKGTPAALWIQLSLWNPQEYSLSEYTKCASAASRADRAPSQTATRARHDRLACTRPPRAGT